MIRKRFIERYISGSNEIVLHNLPEFCDLESVYHDAWILAVKKPAPLHTFAETD